MKLLKNKILRARNSQSYFLSICATFRSDFTKVSNHFKKNGILVTFTQVKNRFNEIKNRFAYRAYWTQREDDILMDSFHVFGCSWTLYVPLFQSKSPGSIKNRFYFIRHKLSTVK